jgi:hypothetical protein
MVSAMADQEEPALAVVLTKNGMTVMRPGMELHYERDAKTQTLIETHSSIDPDVPASEVIAFRKAAWKLALEIAQGLGWNRLV